MAIKYQDQMTDPFLGKGRRAALLLWAGLAAMTAATAEELPPFPDWQCLYVGDYLSGRYIYKIASDKRFSVYAETPGAPCNLCFDKDGTLYAAFHQGVCKITPTDDGSPATVENGHVQALMDGLIRLHGCTLDGQGNLWIAEYMGADTGEINKKGNPVYEEGKVLMRPPGGAFRPVTREKVYSMTTSPAGDVYLSVQSGGLLIKVTPDGTKRTVAKGFVGRTTTFDKEGNAYGLGSHNGILRLSREAFEREDLWPFDFSGITRETGDEFRSVVLRFTDDEYGARHPFSLAIDANGTFYQSDPPPDQKTNPDSQGIIFHFGPDAQRSIFLRVGRGPAWMQFWPTEKPE